MTTALAPAAPIILVTTGHPTLHQHPGAAGEAVHPRLGRLLQPRHLSSVELTAAAGIPWAADNDCFQGLDEPAYRKMLDRLEGLEGCLFVTVPDVVGDAATTLAQFDAWAPELEARGFPLGLVAQDGMTLEDLGERAGRLAALFLGGSTQWKEGPEAAALAVEAKRLGLWVHWGRVNTRRRFDLIVATGAADSFDGSKWARWRKTYLPTALSWLDEAAANRRAAIAAGAPVIDTQETTMPATIDGAIADVIHHGRDGIDRPAVIRHSLSSPGRLVIWSAVVGDDRCLEASLPLAEVLERFPDVAGVVRRACKREAARLDRLPTIAERIADYHVLAAYDRRRSSRYGDMAGSRRGRELNRLADALIDDHVRVDRDGSFPESTPEELAAAFERVARPRIRRLERETADGSIVFGDGSEHRYSGRTRYNGASLDLWRELERTFVGEEAHA